MTAVPVTVLTGLWLWIVHPATRTAGPPWVTLGAVAGALLLWRGARALRRRARRPRVVRGLSVLVGVTLAVWVVFAAIAEAVLSLPTSDVRHWIALGLDGVLGVVLLLLALGVFAEWSRLAEVIGDEERLEREAAARRAAGLTVIVHGPPGTPVRRVPLGVPADRITTGPTEGTTGATGAGTPADGVTTGP